MSLSPEPDSDLLALTGPPRTRRPKAMGIGLLCLAVLIVALEPSLAPGATSGFSFGARSVAFVPSSITVISGAALCALLGVVQILAGFGRFTGLLVTIAIIAAATGLLAWASVGDSLSVTALLSGALLQSVPITLGALAGVLSERAGIVNIAIEGQMLMGAFASAVIGSITQNALLGLAAGIIVGGLIGWLLAVLAIKFEINQVLVGFGINVFVLGLTNYLYANVLQSNPDLNSAPVMPAFAIPFLSELPVVGSILFDQSPFVYIMFALLFATSIALFRTRWGLRVRAVGEHPLAADTVGINPIRIRYQSVVLAGAMAGVGGAYLVLGSVGRFGQDMVGGRGFIALVVVILGGWFPWRALGGALIFGFAATLQSTFGALNVPVPPEFLLMLPYVVTLVAVALVSKRAKPPAASGVVYNRDS